MASTYSNIKIQLMATGENSTTWGNVTNTNLGTALEEAIVGSADVTFASANVTLTLTDTNATQAARHVRLRCTGTTGGSTRNLVVPSIEKPYIVQNDCADSIVVKTAAGTGITVPAGKTMWVYSDGTNVVNVTTHLSSLTLGTPLPISSGGTGSSAALTQGSVVFAGAAGVFSQDNANFFWDDTNNRLGIGTTSPAEKLHIQVNTGASGLESGTTLTNGVDANLFNYVTGTAATDKRAFITAGAANQALTFGTLYTERMRILSDGNVLVGKATPYVQAYRMVVSGDSGATAIPMAINDDRSGTADSRVLAFLRGGTETGYITSTNNVMSVAGSSTLAFQTASSEQMRITNTGLVGIGTTSPAQRLEVNGAMRVGGASGVGFINFSSTVAFDTSAIGCAVTTGFGDSLGLAVQNATGVMTLATNSTERMRITSAGDVGIGTVSPGAKVGVVGGATQRKLSLQGSAFTDTTADLYIGRSGTNNTGFAQSPSLQFGNDTDASGVILQGSNAFQVFTNNAGAGWIERMRITSAGDVGIGTTTPSAKLDVNGSLRANSLTLTTALAVAQGGTGATTASDARTNLGATTVGGNLFTLTNPSAITFPRFNADNTVSALDAATFRSAIGAGTSSTTGTVTSVGGTGTVNGITLTGTVTSSGSLTLGGTLSGVSLTTQVSGTLPIANGGTGSTSTTYCSLTTNVTGTLPVANGGTGQTSYTDGQLLIGNTATGSLSKAVITAGSGITITNGNGSITIASTAGGGSVTSVNASGGTTGLSFSGGPITTSGTLTLAGTLAIANGGTGATSAGAALTALGAYAATNPAGYTTNTGTVTSVGGTGSANGLSLSGTVTTSGNLTLSGSVTSVATGATIDGITIGYRNIPRSTTSGTATASDVGKCIAVTAGITIPDGTFSAGDAVSIYNNSSSAVTLTQGASLTLRLAGTATTGNRTLAARGMATIWFNSSTEAIISGAGVT